MYSWGANSHGQLGLGFSSEMCDSPQQVESLPFDPRHVAAISAGGGHTLVTLATTGEVYCSGWNHRGQLGLGHTVDVCRFMFVGKYDFSSISCGWDVSGAISTERDVYLWGSNLWHQVGDVCEKYLLVPTKLALPNGAKAKKVCFGLRHTCILTEDGKLLLLGKSKWLQKENIQPSVHGGVEFYEKRFAEPISNVASGENHLTIQLGNRRIVCIGDNKFGQCSQEGELNRDQCRLVKQLESGWSHSGYLTADGRVYLWGRNNYRQLGVATDGDASEPVLLDVEGKVEKFCLGSQHGLALTVDGVYTWGWNEHGNCGTGGVENVTTPTRIEGLLNIREIATGAGFCWALKRM